jgi:hypothetical protein
MAREREVWEASPSAGVNRAPLGQGLRVQREGPDIGNDRNSDQDASEKGGITPATWAATTRLIHGATSLSSTPAGPM